MSGGYADVGGEAAVVGAVEDGEQRRGRNPIDGSQDACWVIIPEVGLDLVEGRAFAFHDVKVFPDLGVVLLLEDGVVVEGHVHI